MGRHFYHVGRRLAVAALALVALAGCASTIPQLDRALWPDPRVPVVFVPGITGSELVELDDGESVWGTGKALFWPRDGGVDSARPIPPQTPPRLGAGRELRRIRLAGFDLKDVYQPVAELFARHGYQVGDLGAPRPGDSFFFFPYDWRQDDVAMAGELAAALDGLRRARGEERLRLSLVCQSNGATLCRYLAKYGGGSLEDAERGLAGPPADLEVERLVLVGTALGGSLRILRFLTGGRRYVPPTGRFMAPEVMSTFPALFQDLPSYRPRPFVDAEGRPLDADLFDVATWERYGLGLFDPEIAGRIARRDRPELFGDAAMRRAWVAAQLARASRLHRVLRADVPGLVPPRYYLIQNPYAPTPDRVALLPEGDGWRLAFSDDEGLADRPRLAALLAAPGDGHATVESMLWMSPQEAAAMAAPPFWVTGGHFELLLSEAALTQTLRFLAGVDDAPATPAERE